MLTSPSWSKPHTSLSSSSFVATPPSRRASAIEQLELARRQHDLARAPPAAPLLRVDAQVADGQHAVGRVRRPPHERPQPGHEHDEAERLAQEVVGAELEALGLVVLALLRRQHQDRRPVAPGAQVATHRVAVEAGQQDVEHDRRVRSPRWPATARPDRCGRGRRRSPRRAGHARSPRRDAPRPRSPAHAPRQSDGPPTACGSASQPTLSCSHPTLSARPTTVRSHDSSENTRRDWAWRRSPSPSCSPPRRAGASGDDDAGTDDDVASLDDDSSDAPDATTEGTDGPGGHRGGHAGVHRVHARPRHRHARSADQRRRRRCRHRRRGRDGRREVPGGPGRRASR